MSLKIVKWPKKVKFSRGPTKGPVEYSTGGEDGEDVEVPQLEETLSAADFMTALVNVVGDESQTKQIINRRVFADPAIREGQTKFKGTWKKGKVTDLKKATTDAILAVRGYIPALAKERGAFIAEATKAKNTMDALKQAHQDALAGKITREEFQQLMAAAFEDEEEAA